MIEPKKCDIWISQGNPCKITCHTCNKAFAELSMPMTTDVLKSVCDAYEKRCEMTLDRTGFMNEKLDEIEGK